LEKPNISSFGIIPEETGHPDNDRTGRSKCWLGKIESGGELLYRFSKIPAFLVSSGDAAMDTIIVSMVVCGIKSVHAKSKRVLASGSGPGCCGPP